MKPDTEGARTPPRGQTLEPDSTLFSTASLGHLVNKIVMPTNIS